MNILRYYFRRTALCSPEEFVTGSGMAVVKSLLAVCFNRYFSKIAVPSPGNKRKNSLCFCNAQYSLFVCLCMYCHFERYTGVLHCSFNFSHYVYIWTLLKYRKKLTSEFIFSHKNTKIIMCGEVYLFLTAWQSHFSH